MTSYILDTDHMSLHQRGHEPIRLRLLTVPSDQIATTVISAEEALRGRLAQVRKALKPETRVNAYRWLLKTIVFLCGFKILEFDEKAETHFQKLRSLKLKIGTQDLKIAAIACCTNSTLVTRNVRDFHAIPGLSIEDWS